MPGSLGWTARPTRRPASESSFTRRGLAAIAATSLTAEAAGPGRTSRIWPQAIDRRRLVESIVSPSKEIAPQFVA